MSEKVYRAKYKSIRSDGTNYYFSGCTNKSGIYHTKGRLLGALKQRRRDVKNYIIQELELKLIKEEEASKQ